MKMRIFHPLTIIAFLTLSPFVYAGTIITFQSTACGVVACTYTYDISTSPISYNNNRPFFSNAAMPWFGSGTLAKIISEKIANTYVAYSFVNNDVDGGGVAYFYNGNWTTKYYKPYDSILTWAYVLPDLSDTQSSLRVLVQNIRSIFSAQTVTANFANMNTYDCDVFDRNGMCISIGAQTTRVDGLSDAVSAGVVVGGYQFSPNFRVGAFLNQTRHYDVGTSIQTSHVSPLFGAFAVWNENANHSGFQVKAAMAFQNMDAYLTRFAIGSSEPGQGKTNFSTQSYVGELSYAFLMNEGATIARPYAALRYTRIRQDAYTEFSEFVAPLTFSALEDRTLSALAGVKFDHKLTEHLSFAGSVGFEHDVSHQTDNLVASGVPGLTNEALNTGTRKTRLVASVGAQYRPAKNQVISAEIAYQQLPYDNADTTVGYLRYTIGF